MVHSHHSKKKIKCMAKHKMTFSDLAPLAFLIASSMTFFVSGLLDISRCLNATINAALEIAALLFNATLSLLTIGIFGLPAVESSSSSLSILFFFSLILFLFYSILFLVPMYSFCLLSFFSWRLHLMSSLLILFLGLAHG